MTDEQKHAAIVLCAEDFDGVARRTIRQLQTGFRRLAPTRDPAGNRALLSGCRLDYGRRPAARPAPGGSARLGHATDAGCRDWQDRPERQRPRVESFWLDRAAAHASMNGVLNDGVRGASLVPPERRPSEKCSAAITITNLTNQQQPAKSGKNHPIQHLNPVILA